MKVVFDYEIDDLPYKRVLPPMSTEVIEKLRTYIIGRLSVLSDTMSKQEEYFSSFVCINIITEPKFTIHFTNYSHSLKIKMQAIFTEDDYVYINRLLTEIYSSFLN